jgi:PKHD-type hydroxylase
MKQLTWMMTDNSKLIPNLSKPEIEWHVKKRVINIDNAISIDLCDSLVDYATDHVSKGINKYPHVFGISFHSCLIPLEHEVHQVLQPIWNQTINQLGFNIDFVEPYEIKRYTSNDFFGKHVDNYYSLSKDIDRKITLSVQLTDSSEYTGGELIVLGKNTGAKNKGSVTVFPSDFPHEVAPVQSGVRWSLIGWAWGPYWK